MSKKVVGFFKKNGKTRPITKGKAKLSYHGQTEESSWKQSSVHDAKGRTYLYSTIRRGKVKVTSEKQHRLLHGRKLTHTHVYRTDEGKIVKERVYE